MPSGITHFGSSGIDKLQLFQSIFSALSDAILVADLNGSIVMANPAAASLLGYPAERLIQMNVDDLVPDAIRHRHAGYRRSYAQNQKPRPMGTQMELVAKRADGTEVMVEIALSPLQGHGLPYIVAGIRDVAAYPRMKQALRRARYSEHLANWSRMAVDTRDIHALIRQIPVATVGALQVDGAELLLLQPDEQAFKLVAHHGPWKDCGESIFSLSSNLPDTLYGRVAAMASPLLVADIHAERDLNIPAGYFDCGITSLLLVPVLEQDKTIGLLTACSQTPFPFGNDEVQFLQSLSNLLTTALQRSQSEEALNHAQRLESVGQLTGGIAHDFNNLLTVIMGNLHMMDELPRLAEDTEIKRMLTSAMRASKRAAELTSKLLTFSRRQVLQPSVIDVSAMLDALADMLARTLDHRIVIEVELPEQRALICVDPGQLESALLNIAINARDAMPQGGKLRFSATICTSPPSEALNTLDQVNATHGFVAISIADTGTGMSDEVKQRAFEPFFTTKEVGRGTGLGLSTVYGFVKQSKGAIAIDSSVGQGSTLTLYIPQLVESEMASIEAESGMMELPHGLRVLLVEDDDEVRAAIRQYLQHLRCEVTEANSAEAALALIQKAPTEAFSWDLLLTDVALGSHMTGTELAAKVQHDQPGLPVLLMSGHSSDLLEPDPTAPLAWELLRKPYSRLDLAGAILRVLSTA